MVYPEVTWVLGKAMPTNMQRLARSIAYIGINFIISSRLYQDAQCASAVPISTHAVVQIGRHDRIHAANHAL